MSSLSSDGLLALSLFLLIGFPICLLLLLWVFDGEGFESYSSGSTRAAAPGAPRGDQGADAPPLGNTGGTVLTGAER